VTYDENDSNAKVGAPLLVVFADMGCYFAETLFIF